LRLVYSDKAMLPIGDHVFHSGKYRGMRDRLLQQGAFTEADVLPAPLCRDEDVLLLCGLAITPLRRWTGLLWLIQYRRLVGLFAFFYGCLHLLTYLWLDQNFSISAMAHDVVKRPFITVGTLAWLLLLPLALTSTQKSIRSLGKNWVRLHRLVYIAAAAGAIHFYWLVKRDKQEPLIYLSVLAVLLAWRVAIRVAKNQKQQKAAGVM